MALRSINQWFRKEDGTTAVEFSLIGVPFVFMIIGIIEMAMMFTTQSLIEYGTSQGARLIRTGQVQQGGGEAAFRDAVCGTVAITPSRNFIDCNDLQYQVVALDSFGDAQDFGDPTFDEDGNLQDQSFDAGDVNDVVMIRVAYRYPIMTPMMGVMLSNNGDNARIMLSTTVLQTEPYDFVDE
ncbi:MAG: pilus assembly protein [Alphaproteobacteria bacterium]|nr:pilus assembly protein [Alphaproteobacteria bacterium]NCQ89213.1 pilus assembly protein [Alphaproteobacteria bacterium]NCT08111.1 pilus assembly protein [Alphaproteobacteria bacterium]